MARLRVGSDVFVNPAEPFGGMQQSSDDAMLARIAPFMVKLYGHDDSGQPAGEFSGFIYSNDPFIFTAGCALHFGSREGCSGATSFRAVYHDGFEESTTVVAASKPRCDVMLLEGTRGLSGLRSSTEAAPGDVVYVFGFAPGSRQVSFSKGMMSSTGFGSWHVAAHAGWSGGPALDRRGHLVGAVEHGTGPRILTVRLRAALAIDLFARAAGKSGLEG